MNLIFQKFTKGYLYTIYFSFLFIVFFLFLSLLISISTFSGIVFCGTVVLFFTILTLYILERKINKILYILLGLFFFVIFIFSFKPTSGKDGNFELVCMGNCPGYSFNIFNSISEKELLNAGFQSSGIIGIKSSQLNSFENIIKDHENRITINLPSQIPYALTNSTNLKQYYIYTPENKNTDKIMIVLHGSAGNFLFYQKYLKNFADENGIIIITPSFGWGNRNEKGGTELVFETYNDLLLRKIINKNTQIYLAGLSNGGRGLTRIVAEDRNNVFRKIIFISGVMEQEIVKNSDFQRNMLNKEFLIIAGNNDDRVYFSDTSDSLKFMKGKSIITMFFENGDHFIFVSEGKKIFEKIQKFIK